MALMTASEQPLFEPIRDDLLQEFLKLSVPKGFRAELIEGKIVVTPPPDGDHENIFGAIAWQFNRHSDAPVFVSGNKGLVTPNGRFIPDGTITAHGHFRGAPSWARTAGVLLVFEITSGRPDADRVSKRDGYAAAGIPCYVLVDRTAETVTLFCGPESGVYTDIHEVEFGKTLQLPAPFGFTLDTTPFT